MVELEFSFSVDSALVPFLTDKSRILEEYTLYIETPLIIYRKQHREAAVLPLLRCLNTTHLLRGLCQHEKPPANKLTEPLALDASC